jgi:multicomponent K+:H+ antiporter subunit D
MPPLSGFLGKLLVLDALRAPGLIGWAWSAILVGRSDHRRLRAGGQHAVLEIDASRAGRRRADDAAARARPGPMQVAPVMLTLAVLAADGVFAGPVSAYLDDTSTQLSTARLCRGRPRPRGGGLSHADTLIPTRC